MTVKQDTWLPIFTGYYESIFDCSDSVIESDSDLSTDEYKDHFPELFKAGVTHDFFKENFWNYADFTECFKEASETICDSLTELDHSDIILNIEYQKTVSPKFYNFPTDSINCNIEYDAEKLKSFINSHLEGFTKYIKEKYTSCSGFISSYSNGVSDWLDFENYSAHELGSVLEFVINTNETDAVMSLYDASNCHESFYNYKFDTEKCIKDYKKAA